MIFYEGIGQSIETYEDNPILHLKSPQTMDEVNALTLRTALFSLRTDDCNQN
jgi:hypothetical protein